MNPAKTLSLIAITLTLAGVGVVTLLDSQLTALAYISRLNELNAQHQSLANGLFFLIGIFWIGAIDTTRRQLEPKSMDRWLRFSALAFAGSYVLSMVFPCDTGCPPTGSLNQILHSTLVWGLYAGPAVFTGRILWSGTQSNAERGIAILLLLLFALMQLDTLFLHQMPGVWQRGYDAGFCVLWWMALNRQLSTR